MDDSPMVVATIACELGYALDYDECEAVAQEIGRGEIDPESVARAIMALRLHSFAFAAP